MIFRILLGIVVSTLFSAASFAEPTVFPIGGVFLNSDKKESKLDPIFLDAVSGSNLIAYGTKVKESLNSSFKERVAEINQSNEASSFVASFNVSRAFSYVVNKGNGNFDVVVSLTSSLYFTNLSTGEILFTLSDSRIASSRVTGNKDLNAEKSRLYLNDLDALIDGLSKQAADSFKISAVDIKVLQRRKNNFILDAGYKQGIQVGDNLNSQQGDLVQVVYSAPNYSVAQEILVNKSTGQGATFQKYLSKAVDGRVKPRTLVIAENLPSGISNEYATQLFSDLLGKSAPVSLVVINPQFSGVISTVLQKADLRSDSRAGRQKPELFVRLRVPEPILYTANTNLKFHSIRHAEAYAFADFVDSSGRVLFSSFGHDVIHEDVVSEIAPSPEARRDVVIKNALLDLAKKMAAVGDPRVDRTNLITVTTNGAVLNSKGKIFPPKQEGLLLRKLNISIQGKNETIWIPYSSAIVTEPLPGESTEKVNLELKVPFDEVNSASVADLIFETQTIGPLPKSRIAFDICGPVESLGDRSTPFLADLTEFGVSQIMPGVLVAKSISQATLDLVSESTGFVSTIKWNLPNSQICIQPVDRLTVQNSSCSEKCEIPITARYTLRVKRGEEAVAKPALEEKFKTTDYHVTTEPLQVQRIIDADIVAEALNLIKKLSEKINF